MNCHNSNNKSTHRHNQKKKIHEASGKIFFAHWHNAMVQVQVVFIHELDGLDLEVETNEGEHHTLQILNQVVEAPKIEKKVENIYL